MRKNIGIVGLGDIAQKAYLPVLGRHEGVRIAGVMSRTPSTVERIGEQYRIAGRYTQLELLLEQELDAVFVHTPTETHAEVVTACLERGIDVYVDKPLSYDIRESERMAELALKKGRLLGVGFNRRFAPLYREAKAWLDEAGGFDLCIAQKHRNRLQNAAAKMTLYDDLVHMVDTVLWLGAAPYELKAFVRQTDAGGRLLHATGSVAFGSAAAVFSMSRRAGADWERLELHGGGRSVEVDDLETAVFYDQSTGERVRTFAGWDDTLYRRGFAGVIDHFLQSLDRPELCEIRADQVMETHVLIERLVSSHTI